MGNDTEALRRAFCTECGSDRFLGLDGLKCAECGTMRTRGEGSPRVAPQPPDAAEPVALDPECAVCGSRCGECRDLAGRSDEYLRTQLRLRAAAEVERLEALGGEPTVQANAFDYFQRESALTRIDTLRRVIERRAAAAGEPSPPNPVPVSEFDEPHKWTGTP